ncbi:hypothetical protein DQ04_00981120 [Trypanosoma grayi]|uniref:hypothetical protein n=1 Tax=Trypanosoma grayi TaxID=71804 RepID=UPI0004F49C97|nr:hypothetical protein DQ04_00981120 [Trypanosoma grayi]KEG13482.1 hypothetical protein DQ04_00981120 [Trypanosoma grayi]
MLLADVRAGDADAAVERVQFFFLSSPFARTAPAAAVGLLRGGVSALFRRCRELVGSGTGGTARCGAFVLVALRHSLLLSIFALSVCLHVSLGLSGPKCAFLDAATAVKAEKG